MKEKQANLVVLMKLIVNKPKKILLFNKIGTQARILKLKNKKF